MKGVDIQWLNKSCCAFWYFARKISDLTINLNINLNLHIRNNITKLQSLIHNQLFSPRYREMFKYAWFKCGYVDIRPQEFENLVKLCTDLQFDITNCFDCEVVALKCSWCKKHLCLHFFQQYHYCEDYIE